MAPKMVPMPDGKYVFLLLLISSHSLFGGYYAATRPEGAGWRFFSWHPMLMMLGKHHDIPVRVKSGVVGVTTRVDTWFWGGDDEEKRMIEHGDELAKRGGEDRCILMIPLIRVDSFLRPACWIMVYDVSRRGMFGMMGAAAITKKRGGYTNTKLHGMMAWAGMMLAGGGLYVIYKHKNVVGKDHFTTLHSWAGLAAFGGCISAGLAGGVFLHPDFGVDKQNKLIRSVHKYLSRVLLMLAWMATISGLKTLVGDDIKTLVLFAAPLVVAAPFTLM
ncbi:hypothetical protein ACHAXA_009406 [Cyclostephanos tholiformis]|uniref:Cytochrome b561 domain-containing protein n=1 Tax=Cyclostephanos tholiformis TaxID=382380 RepID=A0ABD3R9L4_9STRA